MDFVESNGRGGYWFSVRARYKPGVFGFKTVGAETARGHYDNGGVRMDLDSIKGFIDTRSVGRWVSDRLPRNANKLRPIEVNAGPNGMWIDPNGQQIRITQQGNSVFADAGNYIHWNSARGELLNGTIKMTHYRGNQVSDVVNGFIRANQIQWSNGGVWRRL